MTSLVVAFDMADVASYLALPGLDALAAEFALQVTILPLGKPIRARTLVTTSADDPLAEYKARRMRARRKWAAAELARDCERLGISTEAGAVTFDPRIAHAGLLMTCAQGGNWRTYLDNFFESVYRDGRPPEDVEMIAGFSGTDLATWLSGDADAALEAAEARLVEMGLFSSPGFLLEEERFLGRQHLPLMRWILAGRNGPPPV